MKGRGWCYFDLPVSEIELLGVMIYLDLKHDEGKKSTAFVSFAKFCNMVLSTSKFLLLRHHLSSSSGK